MESDNKLRLTQQSIVINEDTNLRVLYIMQASQHVALATSCPDWIWWFLPLRW